MERNTRQRGAIRRVFAALHRPLSPAEVLDAAKHPYTKALLSVVPEIHRIEPVVLTGEPPDPTKVPTGCRFPPRCPALKPGAHGRAPAAETAGVATACRTRSLPVLPPAAPHAAACWLVDHETGASIS